jgi:undecaprenyl-phosphate galactose phosphotransferase/putative colanic acid biosynthesis UDP-glucose lipid carrier transferase
LLVKQLPVDPQLSRISGTQRLLRVADLVLAGVIIVFTMPLMAVVALALRYEGRGPILCHEECLGLGGRRVLAFRFRTTVDQRGEFAWLGYRRLTGIGRFLRYTRIDELPQMINVLRGELSVIAARAPWGEPRA